MARLPTCLPVRIGDGQDLAIDGEPALRDLAGIVVILALADLNTDVGLDERGLWLFPGLLLNVVRGRRVAGGQRRGGLMAASSREENAGALGTDAGSAVSPGRTTPVTTSCTVEHHLALIARGAQLRQLVGLGLLDLGASLRFGPGHDEERHTDDLPGRDLLSKALLASRPRAAQEVLLRVMVNVRPFSSFAPGPSAQALAPASRPRLARAACEII